MTSPKFEGRFQLGL